MSAVGLVRGRGVKTFTIDTTAVRIAHVNPNRASLTILALATNPGTVYVAYDDPDVAASGSRQGVPVAANGQITEQPPSVFQGEVWAIGSGAGQVVQVVETDELPGPGGGGR